MYKNQLKLKIHESRSGYLRRKERNANEQKKIEKERKINHR